MAPKEPTRAQLSSRLAYNAQTPAFLRRFQNHVNGNADSDEEEGDPEWEEVGGGRPAIPRRPKDDRPPIPTRPDDDPGSTDEEAGDEAPQIVVLKEGKHLSEWEVENEKRKGALYYLMYVRTSLISWDSEGTTSFAATVVYVCRGG